MASFLTRRPAIDLRREIDQLFENFLSPGGGLTPQGSDEFRLALEMSETEDAYKLGAEVPGLSPDDIDVQVDQGVLTVRGEKRRETEQTVGGVKYTEFNYGTFMRSVQLPPGVDASKIEAKVENGVLSVIVPKGEAARPRRIPLSGAKRPQLEQQQAGQQVAVRGDGGKKDQPKEQTKPH